MAWERQGVTVDSQQMQSFEEGYHSSNDQESRSLPEVKLAWKPLFLTWISFGWMLSIPLCFLNEHRLVYVWAYVTMPKRF